MSEAARGYDPEEQQPKRKPELKAVPDMDEKLETTSLADSMMDETIPGGFELDRPEPGIDFTSKSSSKAETAKYIDRILEDEATANLLVSKAKTLKPQDKNLDHVRKNLIVHMSGIIDTARESVLKGRMSPEKAQDFIDQEFGKQFKRMTGSEYETKSGQEEEVVEGVIIPDLDLAAVKTGRLPAKAAAEKFVHEAVAGRGLSEKQEKSLAERLSGQIKTLSANSIDTVDQTPYVDAIHQNLMRMIKELR